VLANPLSETELPTWGMEETSVVRAPSLEEVRALLVAAEAEDLRFGAFVRVVAATGIRRGEACAIRWSDVDFEAETLGVDESIVATSHGAAVKAPKTRASLRRIALDPGTLGLLDRLRAVQADLAADCGRPLRLKSFVFSAEPGGERPPYPDWASHLFGIIRAKAKVGKDVHLHSLRHFHATMLDPIVSEAQKQARLGWATVHMARHYTDAIPDEDRRAALHFDTLFRGSPT
jgi:integrase